MTWLNYTVASVVKEPGLGLASGLAISVDEAFAAGYPCVRSVNPRKGAQGEGRRTSNGGLPRCPWRRGVHFEDAEGEREVSRYLFPPE